MVAPSGALIPDATPLTALSPLLRRTTRRHCLDPAHGPDRHALFRREPNLLFFMADCEAISFDQGVFYLVPANFDFKHAASVGQGKPKRGVVFGCTTRPEGERSVI